MRGGGQPFPLELRAAQPGVPAQLAATDQFRIGDPLLVPLGGAAGDVGCGRYDS